MEVSAYNYKSQRYNYRIVIIKRSKITTIYCNTVHTHQFIAAIYEIGAFLYQPCNHDKSLQSPVNTNDILLQSVYRDVSLRLIATCKRGFIKKNKKNTDLPHSTAFIKNCETERFLKMLETEVSSNLEFTNSYFSMIILHQNVCLLYTSPSPRDKRQSRMPSSA